MSSWKGQKLMFLFQIYVEPLTILPFEGNQSVLYRVFSRETLSMILQIDRPTLASFGTDSSRETFSFATLLLVGYGESLFGPRLWNGAETRPVSDWTILKTLLKLWHDCDCDQLWANTAPILRIALSRPRGYSKSKLLSHVIWLWRSWSRALPVSDRLTLYRTFFSTVLVIMTWTGRPECSL